MDKTEIKGLAEDIAERGLRVPPLVWVGRSDSEPLVDEDGKPFKVGVVISGKRRLTALALLIETDRANGYEKATPYVSFYGTLAEAQLEAVIENLRRKDLPDYDMAVQVHKLVEAGAQQKIIAKKLQFSTSWISRILGAYRGASPPVRAAWQKGTIPKEAVESIVEAHTTEKGGELVIDEAKQVAALKKEIAARTARRRASGSSSPTRPSPTSSGYSTASRATRATCTGSPMVSASRRAPSPRKSSPRPSATT
jgi:hypothetical protein